MSVPHETQLFKYVIEHAIFSRSKLRDLQLIGRIYVTYLNTTILNYPFYVNYTHNYIETRAKTITRL